MLLAGDVIFTEVRDLLAAATKQVTARRDSLKRRQYERQVAALAEQQLLAGAALALWVSSPCSCARRTAAGVKEPAQWRRLKSTIEKAAPVADASASTPEEEPVIAPPWGRDSPAPPPGPDLKPVAEICADLSSLSDPGALRCPGPGQRGLDATGLIVWVTSNDGASLSPVATHGFDPASSSASAKSRATAPT